MKSEIVTDSHTGSYDAGPTEKSHRLSLTILKATQDPDSGSSSTMVTDSKCSAYMTSAGGRTSAEDSDMLYGVITIMPWATTDEFNVVPKTILFCVLKSSWCQVTQRSLFYHLQRERERERAHQEIYKGRRLLGKGGPSTRGISATTIDVITIYRLTAL